MKNLDITILQSAILVFGVLILILSILRVNVVNGAWHFYFGSVRDMAFALVFMLPFVFIALGLEMLRKKDVKSGN